ncbi:hypothetical protein UY3_17751 [Chelonia mydas]|uniref:Uncharacterized protein n=1 Tax=Chelonia mydas TaxID=8469 RepID=M7AQS9_CHEMY|nr:hypothetical protein UY3_17751 [Chelonia mydas]
MLQLCTKYRDLSTQRATRTIYWRHRSPSVALTKGLGVAGSLQLYQFCCPKQSPLNCHRAQKRGRAAAELPPQDTDCRPIPNAAPSTCLESWCLEPALTGSPLVRAPSCKCKDKKGLTEEIKTVLYSIAGAVDSSRHQEK